MNAASVRVFVLVPLFVLGATVITTRQRVTAEATSLPSFVTVGGCVKGFFDRSFEIKEIEAVERAWVKDKKSQEWWNLNVATRIQACQKD